MSIVFIIYSLGQEHLIGFRPAEFPEIVPSEYGRDNSAWVANNKDYLSLKLMAQPLEHEVGSNFLEPYHAAVLPDKFQELLAYVFQAYWDMITHKPHLPVLLSQDFAEIVCYGLGIIP